MFIVYEDVLIMKKTGKAGFKRYKIIWRHYEKK